jgi:CRISPR-associated protein Csb2
MTRQLCISVNFLDPLFHGKADGGESEWPPSPLRVFQALLASAHTGCRQRDWSDTKDEAFR